MSKIKCLTVMVKQTQVRLIAVSRSAIISSSEYKMLNASKRHQPTVAFAWDYTDWLPVGIATHRALSSGELSKHRTLSKKGGNFEWRNMLRAIELTFTVPSRLSVPA
jgi:hypothetical protein